MKLLYPSFGVIFALIICLAPCGQKAEAASVIPVNSLRVDMQLQTNGSVKVNQQLQLAYPGELSWTLLSSHISDLRVSGDDLELKPSGYRLHNKKNRFLLTSEHTADVWNISYTTTSNLIRHNDRDQFFFKVFQDSNVSISDVEVNFSLPDSANENADLTGNVYSIGGTTPARSKEANPKNVSFVLDLAGPQALLTVNASWSKNVLQLSKLQDLRLSLINLEIIPWLVLGIALPILALLVLLSIYIRQRFGEKRVTTVLEKPPSALSPLVVGVLVSKKIYPEEIVAMLVDLCRRGYLVIVRKNSQYMLGQRKVIDDNLEPWERKILGHIFNDRQKLTDDNLQSLTNQSLYSPEIRSAFSEIYQTITDRDFFVENPHLTRVRYKLTAILMYFAGLAGIVWVAVTGANVALLIPLAATMLISFLVIRLSPQLIRYSKKGLAAREQWQAFGNYLALNEPLSLDMSGVSTFERYLAYAISLGKVEPWAMRFEISDWIIVRPDWFISYDEPSTSQFAHEVVEFAKSISKIVANLRGPLVN